MKKNNLIFAIIAGLVVAIAAAVKIGVDSQKSDSEVNDHMAKMREAKAAKAKAEASAETNSKD